jgi:hypothetical protein
MSSPGFRATVAVVVLVLLGVTTGAVGAFELSQSTSTSTTTTTSYVTTVSPSLNASIRSNPVYTSTNLTNPTSIFTDITKSIGLAFRFEFAASKPLPVAGVLSSSATLYSGTTPAWSLEIFSLSRPLIFNSSTASDWLPTPVSFSYISSVLNESSVIDRDLDVAPAGVTIVVNASFDIGLPGGLVAQNNTSVALTFDYPPGQSGSTPPWEYSAINAAYSLFGDASGLWTTTNSSALTSDAGTADTYLAIAAAALVAAVLVGVLYLPRQRPSTLQRFLSENSENVVRVEADTRMNGKAVRVKDLAELVKLANLSSQPIFLFDSPKGVLLYVIQGDTTFAYTVPPETTQKPPRPREPSEPGTRPHSKSDQGTP